MSREGERRRRKYEDVAQAHWQDWNGRIDTLMQDLERAGGATKRDLAELQRRQYALTGLLGDLKRASDDEWEPLQRDLDAMFQAVERAHRRVEENARGESQIVQRR